MKINKRKTILVRLERQLSIIAHSLTLDSGVQSVHCPVYLYVIVVFIDFPENT